MSESSRYNQKPSRYNPSTSIRGRGNYQSSRGRAPYHRSNRYHHHNNNAPNQYSESYTPYNSTYNTPYNAQYNQPPNQEPNRYYQNQQTTFHNNRRYDPSYSQQYSSSNNRYQYSQQSYQDQELPSPYDDNTNSNNITSQDNNNNNNNNNNTTHKNYIPRHSPIPYHTRGSESNNTNGQSSSNGISIPTTNNGINKSPIPKEKRMEDSISPFFYLTDIDKSIDKSIDPTLFNRTKQIYEISEELDKKLYDHEFQLFKNELEFGLLTSQSERDQLNVQLTQEKLDSLLMR
ncbi:hypothetical protein TBLA_0H03420 [Henningerozyma blattae CBS 6284]|uniref:Transcription regulator LGE1 helical region domain-containing protein n=1 Tax=Henningerozyma blattae (strain ATCC 34711 / CBS 6284 / DSM 70876 / NBRC 10599 / NRRL Y-10934 / UCD 77-7) TaxID=1071380 RepID=I2H8C1_HENB6|nr:hypothetical protein TBLA_0H03420 [Tetrapisispora blattae CBS 6284]CCH62623.1 hypothetical protein TBLA_0H03420 [Tetrapisispora blattae CBS 6284]